MGSLRSLPFSVKLEGSSARSEEGRRYRGIEAREAVRLGLKRRGEWLDRNVWCDGRQPSLVPLQVPRHGWEESTAGFPSTMVQRQKWERWRVEFCE